MKFLVTNADDYGYRPDISLAIVEAHQKGFLTSTTVLVNFVTKDDVALALNNKTLGFGLHLNLTSGEPLSENWKNKYGSFSRPFRNEPNQFDREVWQPFFEKYQTQDVVVEYEAQVEIFKQLFGFMPTHFDSHHYSSSYQTTFPAYKQLALKYKLPVRRPKIWDVKVNQHPMGNITHIPELENDIEKNLIKTSNFFSLKYLNRYNDYQREFKSEMELLRDGESIEISFHPGHDEEWRAKDLEIVCDNRLREFLKENSVELVRFDQL